MCHLGGHEFSDKSLMISEIHTVNYWIQTVQKLDENGSNKIQSMKLKLGVVIHYLKHNRNRMCTMLYNCRRHMINRRTLHMNIPNT